MKPYYFPPDEQDFYPSRAVAYAIKFKIKSGGRNKMLCRLREKGVLDCDNFPTGKYSGLFKVTYGDYPATYFSREAIDLTCDLCADMLESGLEKNSRYCLLDSPLCIDGDNDTAYYSKNPYLKPVTQAPKKESKSESSLKMGVNNMADSTTVFSIIEEHKNEAGQYHRADGPARIDSDGYSFWYQNGLKHRIGAPAVENKKGYQAWYENGQLHRIGGPAETHPDGLEVWSINGKRHRDGDLPAVERRTKPNGYKAWYKNGELYKETVEWVKQ